LRLKCPDYRLVIGDADPAVTEGRLRAGAAGQGEGFNDIYLPCPYQPILVTMTDAPGQGDKAPVARPRSVRQPGDITPAAPGSMGQPRDPNTPAAPASMPQPADREPEAKNAQLEQRVTRLEQQVAELERRLQALGSDLEPPAGPLLPYDDMSP
jgi:hypothetical protein